MFKIEQLVRRVYDGLDTEEAARILEAHGLEPEDYAGEILDAAAHYFTYGPGYGA